MKASNREVVKTAIQVASALAVAIPVFLVDAGIGTEVGAGAILFAVSGAVTKVMAVLDENIKD